MSLFSKMLATYAGDKRSRSENQKIAEQRFRKLFNYARKNSPFYKQLYQDLGEDVGLKDLPPVSKPQLMAAFDEVVTDRNISRAKIEEFVKDSDNIGRKIDGKYLFFKTSGSTGFPADVLYDDGMIDVSSAVAALRTFARKEDFKAFMKHGRKTAGVFADHGFYLACGMSRYLQLKMPWQKNKITVDVNAPEKEIIERLNEFQPAMLSGYPNNLSILADHEELDIHPDVVISGGELLSEKIRNKLQKKFGCYVQTHYSCTEGGEIACECREGHLHLNEDWIIFEAVDKNNEPVEAGVLSDKVLISNLANYIQPFIRYELNDRVIVHEENCPCGKTSRWVEVEGRTDDLLEFAKGISVAPMSLYKILEEVQGLSRFQLIQKNKDRLELRIRAENRSEVFEEARTRLNEYFLAKDISVEIVLSAAEPAPDQRSGKFRHIFKELESS